MNLQPNIFKKGQQEFEQGSIPSNNSNIDPLQGQQIQSAVCLQARQSLPSKASALINRQIQSQQSHALPSDADQSQGIWAKQLYQSSYQNTTETTHSADPRIRMQKNRGTKPPNFATPTLHKLNVSSEDFQSRSNNDWEVGKKGNANLTTARDQKFESNYGFNINFSDSSGLGFKCNKMPFETQSANSQLQLRKNNISNVTQQIAIVEIEKQRLHFRSCDWQRLLFIIQEIILENNNGPAHLWDFINSFPRAKKLAKGRRVFTILAELGLEKVFDQLITQQKKYQDLRKLKRNKISELVAGLIYRIN